MSARTRAAELVKGFEACELVAYLDGNSIWTLGRGHTKDVCEGATCTQAEAETWFLADLQDAEDDMTRAMTMAVPVPLSESMTAALISLVYNIGGRQFRNSEVAAALRAGHYLDVPKHLLDWRMIAGRPSLGLLRRRVAEAALFLEDPLP